MHVAAWYRGTPGRKFAKFGEQVSIARPLIMPYLVILRQKKCPRYLLSRICAPKKSTKVHQKSLPATHQCPSSCQTPLRSAKRCTSKALEFFLQPSLFWRPRGPPGPKFTNLGGDVQIGHRYGAAKF